MLCWIKNLYIKIKQELAYRKRLTRLYTNKMEQIKKRIKEVFAKAPKFELAEMPYIDVSEDPVRPELSLEFRQAYGRKIYGIKDEEGDIAAIMCFAFTNDIPTSVEEMDTMSKDAAMQAVHRAGVQGSIAIAYTVWAKKKGGGKHMVNEVYKMIKESSNLNRLVTLSPLTDMARKFHLKNGAKEVQVNLTTQNFEYDIELEKWEVFKNRAKGWFNIK
jgi:hypothetical protein